MQLINDRTGQAVARSVELAVTRGDRRRGLLGRAGLDEGAALMLAPCNAVHTIGMRFAIDVIFIDRDGHVLKIVPAMRSWRMAGVWRAHAAIELAAGTVREVAIGDRLYLAPAKDRAA